MYYENEKQSHFGSPYAIHPVGKSNRFTAPPESWYAPHRNKGYCPNGMCRIPEQAGKTYCTVFPGGEVSPLSRGHPLTPVQNIC